MHVLTVGQLDRALAIRDLTDPRYGRHAIQLVIDRVEHALGNSWQVPVRRHRGSRVVKIADNYDRLRYPLDDITRASRYTRYVGGGRMLRSHTTAHVPDLLRTIAERGPDQLLLSV